MAMEIWRPMWEMRRLTDEIERMMTQAFGTFDMSWPTALAAGTKPFALNIHRKNSDLMVDASLPGVKPEDIDVNVSGRTLTIKGDYKETKEAKEEQYYCREMTEGRYFRQVTLPDDVQADNAQATYENGVLKLRFPLAQQAKGSQIKVQATGAK